MSRCRLVIDTTVLVSAALLPQSIPGSVVRCALRRHLVLTSQETYDELERVFLRPKFDRYVSITQRLEFLALYRLATELIEVTATVTDCRDPKDNKLLALAIDGRASFIVSSDKDLLALHPFRGIEILAPSEVLTRIC